MVVVPTLWCRRLMQCGVLLGAGYRGGQRLIEQEDARIADEGAPDSERVGALTTRERGGLAVEEFSDLQ
jgi:hypothetical protein